jgi:hypothetical protein
MSHRIKRFSAFAIFVSFYLFAAVDSILGFGGHHVDTKVDTKTGTATTEVSLSDEQVLWYPLTFSQKQESRPTVDQNASLKWATRSRIPVPPAG